MYETLMEIMARHFAENELPLEGKIVKINVPRVLKRKAQNNPKFVEYVTRNKDTKFIAREGVETLSKGLYSLTPLDGKNIDEDEKLSDGYWLFPDELLIEVGKEEA